jgi:hypothetical protein
VHLTYPLERISQEEDDNHPGDLTITDTGPGIDYLQVDNPEGIAAAAIEWAENSGLFK